MRPLTIPTTDSNLPSFLHPLYVEAQSELEMVSDVWTDLKNCQTTYLPKEDKEPYRAYHNRLNRTQFDNRFKPTVKGHAGLLSNFVLSKDIPASIESHKKNIDQQGNSLVSLLTEADEMVLRDGGCGIVVEYPTDPVDRLGQPLITSAADEQLFELRPYLVLINRRDILNWAIEYHAGKPFISFAVIRKSEFIQDGLFGIKVQTFYRVLTPGRFSDYLLKVGADGRWTSEQIRQGETSLNRVPLVWYSISENTLFQADPPFLNLARLNIEHLQKRSGLNEVLHKCNLPVPVRKGLIRSFDDLKSPVAKLVIGPNSVVDIPDNGDFYFAEPTGAAIAATQADIEKLEGAMDRLSLAFLTGGEVQKTATEVVLDTAQTQASLRGMAERKKSAVEQVFDLWAQYTGEQKGGTIEINARVLQVPATPQDVQVILEAMGLKISTRLGLEMLLQRGWLPQDVDLEREISLTEVRMDESMFATVERAAAEVDKIDDTV